MLAEVQAALPDDVLVQTKQQFIDHELAFWKQSTPIGFIFFLGTVMGFIVGVVICYQILYSDIDDHMPEFATLKAMGYANRYFVRSCCKRACGCRRSAFCRAIVVAALLYAALGWTTGLLLDLTAPRVIGRAAVDRGDVRRVWLPGAAARVPGRSGRVVLTETQ